MGTRREKQREEQIKIEEENIKKRNPQAKDAMKDLLKEISSMSKQDWMSIPEAKNTHFKRVDPSLQSPNEKKSLPQFRIL
jgi:hypothetical protein